MQTTTAAQATPRPLIFARHMIGLVIVALANPLIYYDRQPIGMWLLTCLGPIVLAVAAYGLYSVFFTERAKRGWPTSFFMLAWVFIGLFLIGQWSEYNSIRTQKPVAQAPTTSQSIAPSPQLNSSASDNFDPSTARPVDEPASSKSQFDPSTARPVSN